MSTFKLTLSLVGAHLQRHDLSQAERAITVGIANAVDLIAYHYH